MGVFLRACAVRAKASLQTCLTILTGNRGRGAELSAAVAATGWHVRGARCSTASLSVASGTVTVGLQRTESCSMASEEIQLDPTVMHVLTQLSGLEHLGDG